VFNKPPGSDEICPVCGWEDDVSQLRFPTVGGANANSLIVAQSILFPFGSDGSRTSPILRNDVPFERDIAWHPIDPEVDDIETFRSENGDRPVQYPDDWTHLYYWRPSYWKCNR
jgi:hypothetical protein